VSLLRMHIDRADPGITWDQYVEGHPGGHIMQSRGWAFVQVAAGWRPLFVSLRDGSATRAAALVLRRGIPGTGLSLLYAPRGPVLDWTDPHIVRRFADGLQALARQERAFLLQCDPAVPADQRAAHRAMAQMGFHVHEKHGLFRIGQPLRVMRIPVGRYGGPEGLFKSLHHKTRYNIRLAERKGVLVVPRTDREAVDIFYRALMHTATVKGFAVRSFGYHEAIWKHCVQAGHGEYLFAEHDGELLAAILVLRFGAVAWYMYGASTSEKRNFMAPHLLQWTALSRAWDAGCRCYDMRGVYAANPTAGDAEYGVYDFKRKFSAELVTFIGEYDMVVKPWAYSAWRWLEHAAQGPAGWFLAVHQKLAKVGVD
jgi:peptidoglycan pentaglycine glycine transferase (the first glycine)